jgi:hypothetical protein
MPIAPGLFPRATELPAGPPRQRLPCMLVFPSDFLSDFGFRTLRSAGLVELVRLEFGGLQRGAEGREKVLRVVKEAFAPGPGAARPWTRIPRRPSSVY